MFEIRASASPDVLKVWDWLPVGHGIRSYPTLRSGCRLTAARADPFKFALDLSAIVDELRRNEPSGRGLLNGSPAAQDAGVVHI